MGHPVFCESYPTLASLEWDTLLRVFQKSRYSERGPMRFAGSALSCLATVMLMSPLTLAQATQYKDAPPLLLGAAWYPEQWDDATVDRDLERMEAAHTHVARVAEFAWSAMEPAEGQYDWTWLDHAIEKAAKHHVTLRIDENGQRDEHGNRAQFSFTSTKYRELAHGIAEAMAKRYGHNPNVVGWQLDNEYGNEYFECGGGEVWCRGAGE
jgi:beta-galactosidase